MIRKGKEKSRRDGKYLVTNNHPAIISKETFKLVQAEIARRSSKRKTSDLSITEQGKYSGKFALTEMREIPKSLKLKFGKYLINYVR